MATFDIRVENEKIDCIRFSDEILLANQIKFDDSHQCTFIDALGDGVSEFKVDDIPNIIKALNKILALKKGIN